MRKKTKSKSNNKITTFSFAFVFAILTCLIGASINTHYFFKNFFETFSKLNEKPIATITFKYKTAQRKFIESTAWDRLKQQSDLYNGDTIHTSNFSEATVTFNDGNVMILADNTMAQIFLNETNSSAEIAEGSAYVETSESDFVFSSNGKNIVLESNTSANVSKKNDVDSVQVFSGNASISDIDGTYKTISEGEITNVSEEQIEAPKISVNYPRPNQKYVYHTDGLFKIDFQWKKINVNEPITIQISKNKDFSKIEYELITESSEEFNSKTIELSPSVYYWKIENNNKSIQLNGKFNIIQALPPELISPVQDYSYSFRTRKPAIRFIWTESAMASAYNLVISKSKDLSNPIIEQRTSSPSSIISTLDEGTYYWNVTPFFTINKIGFAAESETKSFIIEKKGSLSSPIILIPMNESVVNIEDNAKQTFFSWKNDAEANKYRIEYFKNDSKNSTKSYETDENFLSLKGNEQFDEGKWSWRVVKIDTEGNEAFSNKNIFYAMKGKPEQKTIEPTNNYKVAENLLRDMTFTWKKTLPDGIKSVLQISDNEDFSNIIQTLNADGYSTNGVSLPIGKYYWRLVSTSIDNSFELKTPAKTFFVLENLKKAVLLDPINRAIVRENVPYTFKWSEVEGADYYKFTLTRFDGLKVREETVFENSVDVEMYYGEEFIDKGYYHWEVQAKSNAIPGVVSRRNGDLSEGNFQLIKLKPVEIKAPKKNQKIDGIDAVLKKVRITWDSVDETAESRIVVSKVLNNGQKKVVYSNPTDAEIQKGKLRTVKSVLMSNPDLRNGGNYEVIVYAKTYDGIDISNTDSKRIGRFSILPIPPLEAPKDLNAKPRIFGLDYLSDRKNPRKIRLEWDKVKNATDYIVVIKNSKGRLVLKTEVENRNYYDISWLNLVKAQRTKEAMNELYNDTFTWTVEAIRMIDTNGDGENDTVLQQGKVQASDFIVDIPQANSSSGTGAKNPYGN